MILSTTSEDDRHFQKLTKKLDEKLFSMSPGIGPVAYKQLNEAKKDALQKMEIALNEGNLFAASFYQAQYRWCKLALREY